MGLKEGNVSGLDCHFQGASERVTRILSVYIAIWGLERLYLTSCFFLLLRIRLVAGVNLHREQHKPERSMPIKNHHHNIKITTLN